MTTSSVNKPRITLSRGNYSMRGWWCESQGCIAAGATPKEAWDNWQRKCATHYQRL